MIPKIVLTGGPKAGKRRVAEAIASRHPGIRLVPDGARILIDGGFPATGLRTDAAQVAFQRAVAAVRMELESLASAEATACGVEALVCMGGLLDGAAHLSGGVEALCGIIGVRPEFAYRRYGAVIHLESPATGDPGSLSFEPGAQSTLVRWQSVERTLRSIWRRHRTWLFVAYSRNLTEKTAAVERLLAAMNLEKAA